MDNAKALIICHTGIADELSSKSPRSFHIENSQVTILRMPFYFGQPVSRRAQHISQVKAFVCDQRDQLVAESEALFDGDSKERPTGEAQAIGQRIYGMVHIQEDLGYRADVHNRFEKAQDRREPTPALNNGYRSDSVQCHVCDSRQDD
jgi:hypothetical protein